MPAVPFLAVIAVETGAAAAIGTALASAVGVASVSTVAATAIGLGTISAATTAVQGGSASDILKSAVLGGLTSYVGGTIAANIGQSVATDAFFSAVDAGFTSLATPLYNVVSSGVQGAITSSFNALINERDPIDALIKGGLTAGLTAGVSTAVKEVISQIPGIESIRSTYGGSALERALTTAVAGAAVSGKDFNTTLLTSLAATGTNTLFGQIKSELKDFSSSLKNDSDVLKRSEEQVDGLINREKDLVTQINNFNANTYEPLRQELIQLSNNEKYYVDLINGTYVPQAQALEAKANNVNAIIPHLQPNQIPSKANQVGYWFRDRGDQTIGNFFIIPISRAFGYRFIDNQTGTLYQFGTPSEAINKIAQLTNEDVNDINTASQEIINNINAAKNNLANVQAAYGSTSQQFQNAQNTINQTINTLNETRNNLNTAVNTFKANYDTYQNSLQTFTSAEAENAAIVDKTLNDLQQTQQVWNSYFGSSADDATLAKLYEQGGNDLARGLTKAQTAYELIKSQGVTPEKSDVISAVVNNQTPESIASQYVTFAEARQFLSELGYNPSDQEVNNFVGKVNEDAVKSNVASYVNPRQVTYAEAESYLRSQGYAPTDAEIRQFVGQINESETQERVRGYVGPRQVTEAEAAQYLRDLGYNPSYEEIKQFAGQINEDAAKTNIATYVDPRLVSYDEAAQYLRELGFEASEDEIRQFVGQIKEDKAREDVRAFVNPRQVTESEARQFLQSAGYNPTDEEVKQFTGQINESTAQANIAAYVNPRQVTEAEARAFFEANGYFPTDEEIKQFVGQINEDTAQQNIRSFVSQEQEKTRQEILRKEQDTVPPVLPDTIPAATGLDTAPSITGTILTDEFAGYDSAIKYAQAIASGATQFDGVEAAQRFLEAKQAGALDYQGYDMAKLEATLIGNQPTFAKALDAAKTLYGPNSTFNWQGQLINTSTGNLVGAAPVEVPGSTEVPMARLPNGMYSLQGFLAAGGGKDPEDYRNYVIGANELIRVTGSAEGLNPSGYNIAAARASDMSTRAGVVAAAYKSPSGQVTQAPPSSYTGLDSSWLSGFGHFATSAGSTIATLGEGVARGLGQNELADKLQQASVDARTAANSILSRDNPDPAITAGVSSGISSGLSLILTGGTPWATALGPTMIAMNETFRDGQDRGMTVEDNTKRTIGTGIAEYVGEYIGNRFGLLPGAKSLGAFFKELPVNPSAAQIKDVAIAFAKANGIEQASEAITTALNIANDQLYGITSSTPQTLDELSDLVANQLKTVFIATNATLGLGGGAFAASSAWSKGDITIDEATRLATNSVADTAATLPIQIDKPVVISTDSSNNLAIVQTPTGAEVVDTSTIGPVDIGEVVNISTPSTGLPEIVSVDQETAAQTTPPSGIVSTLPETPTTISETPVDTGIISTILSDQIIAQPVVTQPVVTSPVDAGIVSTIPSEGVAPVITEPTVTQPVVTQPVVTEPVVTEPVVTEPVIQQPTETQPEVITKPDVQPEVVTQPEIQQIQQEQAQQEQTQQTQQQQTQQEQTQQLTPTITPPPITITPPINVEPPIVSELPPVVIEQPPVVTEQPPTSVINPGDFVFTPVDQQVIDTIINTPINPTEPVKPTTPPVAPPTTPPTTKPTTPSFPTFPVFVMPTQKPQEYVDYGYPNVPPPELYGIFNLPPPEYTRAYLPIADVGIMSGTTK